MCKLEGRLKFSTHPATQPALPLKRDPATVAAFASVAPGPNGDFCTILAHSSTRKHA